ncbi:unnamed protein product, partial [Rotaria magnacalcarata]
AEPQGEIRAQHSVDTIVRLLDTSASSANQNVVHKIRVQFFDRRKSQDLIGDPLVIFILTILGAVCAFVLVLPTIPDSDNSFNARIPSYLHMTTNSKVIASYILGLLTVVFIRR